MGIYAGAFRCRHPIQSVDRKVVSCNAQPRYREIVCSQSSLKNDNDQMSRRMALMSLTASGVFVASSVTSVAEAIQGLTAGRIPGITGPDSEGYYTYTRPEGKSGGHGVGWTEIPRYSFKVPKGWEEIPVSIADLGGTEIDLRYGEEDCGSLQIVVAPVLRFLDIGFNANVDMEDLGPPQKIIEGFHPELYGGPLLEGDVLDTQVVKKDGSTHYMYNIKPHRLVNITAVGNRVFILATNSNSLQWRRAEKDLRKIQESFSVPRA